MADVRFSSEVRAKWEGEHLPVNKIAGGQTTERTAAQKEKEYGKFKILQLWKRANTIGWAHNIREISLNYVVFSNRWHNVTRNAQLNLKLFGFLWPKSWTIVDFQPVWRWLRIFFCFWGKLSRFRAKRTPSMRFRETSQSRDFRIPPAWNFPWLRWRVTWWFQPMRSVAVTVLCRY